MVAQFFSTEAESPELRLQQEQYTINLPGQKKIAKRTFVALNRVLSASKGAESQTSVDASLDRAVIGDPARNELQKFDTHGWFRLLISAKCLSTPATTQETWEDKVAVGIVGSPKGEQS